MSFIKKLHYLTFCLFIFLIGNGCEKTADQPNSSETTGRVFDNLCELLTADDMQAAFNQPVNLQTSEKTTCIYSGVGNSAAFITLTATLLTGSSVADAHESFDTSIKLLSGTNQIIGDVGKMVNGKIDTNITANGATWSGVGDEAWLKPGGSGLAMTQAEVRKGLRVLGVSAMGLDTHRLPEFQKLVKSAVEKL